MHTSPWTRGDIQLFAKANRFPIRYRIPLFVKREQKEAGRDGVGDDASK
jgi:hypothetical protein